MDHSRIPNVQEAIRNLQVPRWSIVEALIWPYCLLEHMLMVMFFPKKGYENEELASERLAVGFRILLMGTGFLVYLHWVLNIYIYQGASWIPDVHDQLFFSALLYLVCIVMEPLTDSSMHPEFTRLARSFAFGVIMCIIALTLMF